MSYISVDVDVDDIVSAMGRYDRRKFFESMKSGGYISESCIITYEGEVKAPVHIERNALVESQDEFNIALNKLWNNGWKLTKEQEDYVINLAKRF
jgi:hypothetical protein